MAQTKEEQKAADDRREQERAAVEQQRQAAQRATQEAKDQAEEREFAGRPMASSSGVADPMGLIARALDRLAPQDPAAAAMSEPPPPVRKGGVFRVGDRLVNANGQEIKDAKPGEDGKLYGGVLYDPREGKVVREFAADELNEG